MKKTILIPILLSLCACAELSSFMPSSTSEGTTSSVKQKMQTCMLSEAQSRWQAGTLLNDTIRATAQDIIATCTKKLALSSLGISEEYQQSAENIIANLRNLQNN